MSNGIKCLYLKNKGLRIANAGKCGPSKIMVVYLGAIQIIRDTFFALFWPPPPPMWYFIFRNNSFYPWVVQFMTKIPFCPHFSPFQRDIWILSIFVKINYFLIGSFSEKNNFLNGVTARGTFISPVSFFILIKR